MIQLILCLISAIMSSWWINSRGINHWYVWQKDWSPSGLSTIAFFSYFLLYNTMIPISLVVSLEFVKVFQIYFIMCDEDMYSPLRGKYVSA